ncbi:hypothetical protein V5799_015100 [Amblyomma americanum]|uniref:Uncharacterized protein n=1 Tax=Amblyomma americanum TaxID=6943 RepID=A0AAQ4E144_AMBAM
MTVASFAPQSVAYWWPSQLLKRYFGSNDQTTLPAATAALYEANGILHPTTSAPETAPPTTTNQEVADPAVTPTLATSEALDGDPVPRPLSDNLVAGAIVSTDGTSQATTFTPKATTHVQLTETVTASSTRVFAPVETYVFASDTDSPDDGAFKPHTDDLSVAHVATTSLEATEPTPTAQYVTTISSPSLLELADATMPAPASGFMDSTTSVAANEVNSDTKTAAPGQLATSPFTGGVETISSPSHFATSDDVKHLEDVSTSAAETQTSVPKTYMVPYVSDAGSASNTVTVDGVETGSTMFSVLTSDGTFRTPTNDYTVATIESLTFATDMSTLTLVNTVAPTAKSQSPSTSNDMEVTAIRATKDDSSTTTGNGEYLPVTEPEADYTTFATALSATRPGTISAEEIGQVPPAITAPNAVSIKMDTSTTASPTSYTTKPQNVTPSEDYVDLDVTSVLQQAPTSSSMSSSSSGQTHSSHKEVDYGLLLLQLPPEPIANSIAGLTVALIAQNCGLNRRLSYNLILLVGPRVKWLMLSFMSMVFFLSMFISNVAVTSMMMTVVDTLIYEISQSKLRKRVNELLRKRENQADEPDYEEVVHIESVAAFTSRRVAHDNLITSFTWMLYCFPVGMISMLMGWVFLYTVYLKEYEQQSRLDIREVKDVVKDKLQNMPRTSYVTDSSVGFLIVFIAFMIPVKSFNFSLEHRLMEWKFIQKNMPWAIIFIIGGGSTLTEVITRSTLFYDAVNAASAVKLNQVSNLFVAVFMSSVISEFTNAEMTLHHILNIAETKIIPGLFMKTVSLVLSMVAFFTTGVVLFRINDPSDNSSVFNAARLQNGFPNPAPLTAGPRTTEWPL